MGVLDDLGYAYPEDTWLSRLNATIVSSRPGAWFFQRTAHRLDRRVLRLTNGRESMSSMLVRKPVLLVTTKGRHSGLARTIPLLGIPFGDAVAIIGTNFGQAPTPGWVHNLRAEPRARIAHRDRTLDVRARPATAGEFDEVFAEADAIYGGYAKYLERIDGREVQVFILERV